MRARSLLGVVVIGGLVTATSAAAGPVVTEVAWGGDPTSDSGNDEWVEIHNPEAQPIDDLSAFVLVGAGTGTASLSLPPVSLAAGAFFIVENTAGVPQADAALSFAT